MTGTLIFHKKHYFPLFNVAIIVYDGIAERKFAQIGKVMFFGVGRAYI